MAVLVAVHNEADNIAEKLRELSSIEYPADRLQLLVIDGRSSDGTAATLTEYARRNPRIVPVFSNTADKTAQLNEGLTHTAASWILVTDADARMPADTLRRLVEAGEADVAVVGTPILPHGAHPLEECHWRWSNRIRRLEWRLGSAGLVAAPCYLFRRTLLDRFPTDSYADDVYVCCRAAVAGARVALVETGVRELRVATTAAGWYRHKLRRTLGYLHEVIRFLPLVRRMRRPMREVFLWRALTMTAGPLAGVAMFACFVALVGWPALALLALVALSGVSAVSTQRRAAALMKLVAFLALPLWIVMVIGGALACYPFVRQTACFPRTAVRAGEPEVC